MSTTSIANGRPQNKIVADVTLFRCAPAAPSHPFSLRRPLSFDSNGGARLVLARMRRYSASLLVQESGFHQLVAEFNRGRGIARASLAQEVAIAVADAMKSFSQVCKKGHAARAMH